MDTLDITQVRASFEITSRPAKLKITSKRPVLTINRTRPRMSVNKKIPTFKVNWLNVQSALNLTPILVLSSRFARESVQKGLEAIGDIAERGNALMHIENGGNPIAEIARERTAETRADVNLALIMHEDLQWDNGFFTVEWSRHTTQLDWEVPLKPDITVEPHSVDIKMVSHPRVNIKVNKHSAKTMTGARVDQKV